MILWFFCCSSIQSDKWVLAWLIVWFPSSVCLSVLCLSLFWIIWSFVSFTVFSNFFFRLFVHLFVCLLVLSFVWLFARLPFVPLFVYSFARLLVWPFVQQFILNRYVSANNQTPSPPYIPMPKRVTRRRSFLESRAVDVIVRSRSRRLETAAVFQPDADRHFRRFRRHLIHLTPAHHVGCWSGTTAHTRTLGGRWGGGGGGGR